MFIRTVPVLWFLQTNFRKAVIFPSPTVLLTGPSEHDPFVPYTWHPKQYTCSDSIVQRVPKTAMFDEHVTSGYLPCRENAGLVQILVTCQGTDCVYVNGVQSSVHQRWARRYKDGPYLTNIVCHFMSPRSSQECVFDCLIRPPQRLHSGTVHRLLVQHKPVVTNQLITQTTTHTSVRT